MNDSLNTAPKNQLKSRLKLVFIILLFAGPLVAAFTSYYGNGLDFSLRGQTNNAPLIDPAVSLKEFQNESLSGNNISLQELSKKWSVVHFIESGCDDLCKQELYNSRQTRLAVGKDIKRIKRYIVVENWDADGAEPEPTTLVGQIRNNHPDATILKTSGNGLEKQVIGLPNDTVGPNDAVLIDPLGNMMMVIPVDMDPRLLLKDFKKLLKLSRIG